MPFKIEVLPITPDETTLYLVGPEGLVWVQPAIGEAVIIAARDEMEQLFAAAHVGELLRMGLVPYGLPLNQRAAVAMFGGSPLRDCRWLPWADAPAPTGADQGDPLPTQAVVIVDATSAAAIGRKGGLATSPTKTAANRINGKKGGRPKRPR